MLSSSRSSSASSSVYSTSLLRLTSLSSVSSSVMSSSSSSSGSSSSKSSLASSSSSSISASSPKAAQGNSTSSTNSTALISGKFTTPAPADCTGCLLQAYCPWTLTFIEDEDDEVDTITATVTYMVTYIEWDDTIETINNTIFPTLPTVNGTGPRPTFITERTFEWTPVPEVILTL